MTRPASLLLALLLAVAACSGDDDPPGTTVTANEGSVIFGQGEIPPGIPTDFPIPDGAVIGSTLIDKVNNRTEMNMVIRLASQAGIRFYEVGLVNQGYVVNSSTGSGNAWTILFSRGELEGTLVVTPQGDVSQIGVTVNQT